MAEVSNCTHVTAQGSPVEPGELAEMLDQLLEAHQPDESSALEPVKLGAWTIAHNSTNPWAWEARYEDGSMWRVLGPVDQPAPCANRIEGVLSAAGTPPPPLGDLVGALKAAPLVTPAAADWRAVAELFEQYHR